MTTRSFWRPFSFMIVLLLAEKRLQDTHQGQPLGMRGRASCRDRGAGLLHSDPESVMDARVLDEQGGRKTIVIIFDEDDEVMAGLHECADRFGLNGSHFTALGALREATLAFFDIDAREYQELPVREQVEVVSLLGNVATGPEGEPTVHAHAVLGLRDGRALGGHLLRGVVRPTLEVTLVESPGHLQRRLDEKTNLPLIRL
jgi:predicted DNA-binding protein with PD1-like motif